ncbi:MAG: 2-phosphosulfolactate phosphatase family protein [Oscillatoriales cyanobacterium]|nr:MAG: 2-phosphosulfolactate phosphatase family protein [Oscillatoriales cyanobacterium]
MKISIFHTPELTPDLIGTASPTTAVPDCAIAIDVLRATTTIATALAAGADSVQAFCTIDGLMTVSEDWPADRRIRIGERGGKTVEGCDLGNSPLDCTPDRVGGKRLFMSTTNGTRALQKIQNTPIVLAAALVNRRAIVDFLLDRQPETLWMTASGWEGSFSLEDTVCAGAIIAGLLEKIDRDSDWFGNDEAVAALALYEQWRDRLLQLFYQASHGQRLLRLGLTEDLAYCASQDQLNIVPIQVAPGVIGRL